MRELRRLNRNGTQLTFLNDAGNQDLGFDAVQRITRLRVLGAGGPASPIVDREYGYNRASQRTFEKRNDDHGLTDRYTYDSSYRIVASSFDQDGLPGAVARDLSAVGYRYDGVGNRRDVSKTTISVGVLAESYGVNALNQYTSIAAGATPAVVRDHDDNGNLTDDGSKLFTFDYKNRLVGAQRKSDSAPIALYSYLADGRRVRKQVWNPDGGALVRDTRFVLDGAREVEEQDWSSGATTTTYVWSPVYVDELVEFTNASGSSFAHQDARCNVVAVTNAAGAVVERRRFDDFGRVEVRDAGGAVVRASPSGCEYGFQGRRLDPETGLVFFRARYYSPETGRFVQRDPVWDAGNVGGQYTFCGNGPGSGRDPGGLDAGDNAMKVAKDAKDRRAKFVRDVLNKERRSSIISPSEWSDALDKQPGLRAGGPTGYAGHSSVEDVSDRTPDPSRAPQVVDLSEFDADFRRLHKEAGSGREGGGTFTQDADGRLRLVNTKLGPPGATFSPNRREIAGGQTVIGDFHTHPGGTGFSSTDFIDFMRRPGDRIAVLQLGPHAQVMLLKTAGTPCDWDANYAARVQELWEAERENLGDSGMSDGDALRQLLRDYARDNNVAYYEGYGGQFVRVKGR